jgi:hypothetical protein
MATTFKQLLNRALRITGEDEIPSGESVLTDDNHLLVAEVANEIKEEVEAAHNWRALRQTVTVAFSASETVNTITEANERSRMVRIQDPLRGRELALAYDITDTTSPVTLHELDLADLIHRRKMNPNVEQDPWAFALDNTEGDVLKVQLFPTPADARTIELTLVIPQSRLDGTVADDLADNIMVPVRPITLGLIRWILEERGEELGVNSQYSEEKEMKALWDAVSLDSAEQGDYNLVPE